MSAPDRPTVLDEPTFAAIWREHATRIETYLRHRVGREVAEDLAQDTFLKAWRVRDQYQPDRGTAIAWLYVIAASVAADHFRATGRRPSTVDLPDHDSADPTDVAQQVCDRAEVAEVLAHVPDPADRELLADRYLADQSVAQAAATRGVSTAAVKSRTNRVMTALRTALGVVAPVTPADVTPPAVEPAVPTEPPARSTPVAHPVPPSGRRRATRPVRPGRCPGGSRVVAGVPDRTAGPAVRVRARPTAVDPPRRRLRPRTARAVPACPLRRQQLPLPRSQRPRGGDPLMHHHYPPAQSWPDIFVALVAFFVLLGVMLSELRHTNRWKPWVQRATGIHGRHTRYQTNRRDGVRFATGIAQVATPTVFPPTFVPDPDQPEEAGEREGDEPVPDPTIPVDPAALAQLERDFHTGYTTTHPGAAALIRDVYRNPEKYRTLAGVR